MTFKFQIRYESRGVLIEITEDGRGRAEVTGEYDGPSKPEAMVRVALADAVSPGELEVKYVPDCPSPP